MDARYYVYCLKFGRCMQFPNVARMIAAMKNSIQQAGTRAQRERPAHYAHQPDRGYPGMPYTAHPHPGTHFVHGATAPY